MQASPTKKVLIVGGGIAGPVAAVALRRAGMEVEIYEGRAEPADDSGFLGLSPNGVGVLETLGIAGHALKDGFDSPGLVFQNHRGKTIGEITIHNVVIKRSLLNQALSEAAIERGVQVHFGKRLKGLETNPSGMVVARLEDGTVASGDVLLGCDGIHSRTRQAIMPDAPKPVYTGVVGCGGYARASSAPAMLERDGTMWMTFGLRGFFAYMFSPAGELGWFDNFAGPAEPDGAAVEWIDTEEWRQMLLQVHAGDHEPIPEMLRSTEGPILRIFIHDMPPLPTWHKGSVCLIGDAAHATSPHVGQGASLAMEDAIEVARCLRDVPDAEQAFEIFEGLRKERVDKLVREARRSGNQKALSNPIARRLRDLALPLLLKRGSKDAERAFTHRVCWEERVA
jgi:2-polyprenyl-6-methoxyphenol hydroxylase-like FAD-dependent oxidoreductase